MELWRRWKGLDWRVKAIVIPVVLATVASLVIWYIGYGRTPSTFFGAVFASWLGGLALFAVVGSVAAYVSLAQAHQEAFDARARILFRRQTGKHIDYIITRIKEILEHYSETTETKVTFLLQHDGEAKFRLSIETTSKTRAYIDDIASTFSSEVRFTDVSPPPPGVDNNRIVFLRLNGELQPDFSCDFATEIVKPYHATIEPGKVLEIHRCSEIWTKAESEDNTHTPARYTQDLALDFENRLPSGMAIMVRLSKDQGATWEEWELRPGEAKNVLRHKDAAPGKELYRYRVSVC